MQKYAKNLSWTIPFIEKFILDRAQTPVVISLYNIWEMDYADPTDITLLQGAVLKILDHKSFEVKLGLVHTVTNYYEDTSEARHILDKKALEFYIRATYDSNEEIRDWALFKLWTSVENLNSKAAKAFNDAYERESSGSEAHVEAAIGMARMGLQYEHLIPTIVNHLSMNACGTGWIDAAEEVHSSDVLLALLDLYEHIVASADDDEQLEKIENVIRDWSD